MTSAYDKLTPAAIQKMLEGGDAQNQTMIVQIFDIKETKSGKIACCVSDGDFFTKALLNDSKILKQGQNQLSIICIQSHAVLKNSIGVTTFKFVAKYPEKLGIPKDWTISKENIAEFTSDRQYKLEKTIKAQPRKIQPPTASKSTTGKTSQYELIDDLYIGLARWTILCRITRKILKESPKQGKKILEIQLVDKSKKRILGTFFSDAAVDFNDYLKEGSIYEISKGRLIEGNYNNSKNEKISPYALIFDSKSQFNEVSDVNIIAKAQDTAITLGQIYERRVFNQEFDVVAYVVEVKQQASFTKEDKTITVKEVILSDPEAKITMSVMLWRWKQEFGPEMVGRVLIFSRFLLNDYKGSICLKNGIRSAIISHHEHPMKKYEGKRVDTSSFAVVTETRQRQEDDPLQLCFNTKDLAQKAARMQENETIKSVLIVWVNRFASHKKWNYEACPKCKKTAQKYSKCNSCGNAIQETNLSFLMGIQVSDFYGSIWITAYDDLAKKIFHDMGNTAANQLQQLSKDELEEKLQSYLYQPLKLKILTKKDQQGRIRHNVPKMFEINDEKEAKENLKKIQQMISVRN